MIELNGQEKVALNKMIERSKLAGVTLTEEDMEYYNAHYEEQNQNAAKMLDISRKLRELMIIDTESAEILRDAYNEDYYAAVEENERTNAQASMTGIKKMINFKIRNRAKARQASILSKKELVDSRREFDDMYNRYHSEFCQQYDNYKNTVGIMVDASEGELLERTVSRLGYRAPENVDETANKERKSQFLHEDQSMLPRLKKLDMYNPADRAYQRASADFNFAYGNDISTGWVKRDIVGYTSSMTSVEENSSAFKMHADNLEKIVVNKDDASEGVSTAVRSEMRFLHSQLADMDVWREARPNLFGKELPKGRETIKSYVMLTRAIKKLQISKTATKAIYQSAAYKNLPKAERENFEKNTMPKIWAMHSYVSGLIAICSRHFSIISGDQPIESKIFTWDENVKASEKTNYKKEIK